MQASVYSVDSLLTNEYPDIIADTYPSHKYIPALDSLNIVKCSKGYNLTNNNPFNLSIRSNLICDALLLPNIGFDFYLDKGISLGLNLMYAWWSNSAKVNFWRAYGTELNMRWWPVYGKDTYFCQSSLKGHHIGACGQIYTYDL